MFIASLAQHGINYAPPQKKSRRIYETDAIKKAFPIEWYRDMEKCELRVGSSWRGNYIYHQERNNPSFGGGEQKRYDEWIDIHKFIFQVLEEYIQGTLEIQDPDVMEAFLKLWPFLPWEPSRGGVSGDRQSLQIKRLLQRTKVHDRKYIDTVLDRLVEACITKKPAGLPWLNLYGIPKQHRHGFEKMLRKRMILETPPMFWPLILGRDRLFGWDVNEDRFEVRREDVEVFCWNNHPDGGLEVLYLWNKLKVSQISISCRGKEGRNLTITI